MTELIKVSTDLLFKDGDPCEFTISRNVDVRPPFEQNKAFRGTIVYGNNDLIQVKLDFVNDDNSPVMFQVPRLEIAMSNIAFSVLLSPEETRSRITSLIETQRIIAGNEYRKTLDQCNAGEKHLLEKYNLVNTND